VHEFGDRLSASEGVADWIAAALRNALEGQESASLVVSGGRTPRDCFFVLSNTELDWSRVSIFLSDERCVPPDHEDSNEGLVRRTLATGRARDAEVVPIYRPGEDPAGQCGPLARRLRAEPAPFAAVLLGMGADGHFASLFPDAPTPAAGLDLASAPPCLPVTTAASPHPRITLTLPTLLRTDTLILLAFGQAKRDVLEDAAAGRGDYPVQVLLAQQRTPLTIAWAP